MKSEVIRECCLYAKEFEYTELKYKDYVPGEGESYLEDSKVELPCGSYYSIDDYDEVWDKVYYPLLLQRTIEGINLEGKFTIKCEPPYYFSIFRQSGEFLDIIETIPIEGDIDEAKANVIEFVFEMIEEDNSYEDSAGFGRDF